MNHWKTLGLAATLCLLTTSASAGWKDALNLDAAKDLVGSLKSSNDEANKNQPKDKPESERLMELFVESMAKTNEAQILLASAFGLKEDAAALEAESKALQSGAVESQSELKKIKEHSIRVNEAVQEKMKAGDKLSDEGLKTYAKSFLPYAEGVTKLNDVKQNITKVEKDFKSSSLTKAFSGASTTLFLSTETPEYLMSLYETSKMMISYAGDNNVDVPDDAQEMLSSIGEL